MDDVQAQGEVYWFQGPVTTENKNKWIALFVITLLAAGAIAYGLYDTLEGRSIAQINDHLDALIPLSIGGFVILLAWIGMALKARGSGETSIAVQSDHDHPKTPQEFVNAVVDRGNIKVFETNNFDHAQSLVFIEAFRVKYAELTLDEVDRRARCEWAIFTLLKTNKVKGNKEIEKLVGDIFREINTENIVDLYMKDKELRVVISQCMAELDIYVFVDKLRARLMEQSNLSKKYFQSEPIKATIFQFFKNVKSEVLEFYIERAAMNIPKVGAWSDIEDRRDFNCTSILMCWELIISKAETIVVLSLKNALKKVPTEFWASRYRQLGDDRKRLFWKTIPQEIGLKIFRQYRENDREFFESAVKLIREEKVEWGDWIPGAASL